MSGSFPIPVILRAHPFRAGSTILAVGRPIIVAAEPHSEAALVVNEEAIGWVVPPEDPDQLANAIRLAASDRAATAQKGRRAATAAEKTIARMPRRPLSGSHP